MVADVLSRKARYNTLRRQIRTTELAKEQKHLNMQIVSQGTENMLKVQPTLEEQIEQAQKEDRYLNTMKRYTGSGKAPGF